MTNTKTKQIAEEIKQVYISHFSIDEIHRRRLSIYDLASLLKQDPKTLENFVTSFRTTRRIDPLEEKTFKMSLNLPAPDWRKDENRVPAEIEGSVWNVILESLYCTSGEVDHIDYCPFANMGGTSAEESTDFIRETKKLGLPPVRLHFFEYLKEKGYSPAEEGEEDLLAKLNYEHRLKVAESGSQVDFFSRTTHKREKFVDFDNIWETEVMILSPSEQEFYEFEDLLSEFFESAKEKAKPWGIVYSPPNITRDF